MEEERDDEAATEERGDQDEEEEEDDEGEDIDSVKIYVKSIIAFDDDDDDERNPHATSSPKGNITIIMRINQCYSCTILYYIMLPSMKYEMFYLCNLQLFPNYLWNPNPLKMSRHTNGFN